MFVMLYNNFVNPTHLIYCYQRVFFFEDLALNQTCLYTAFIYLFMCLFILGRRKVKMLRCCINDRLQNSRFPFFSKLFSLSADWWRKILMQSKRASSFVFETWLPYDQRKNLFDKRKNPAVCNLGESPSLYEIMIVIHVLLETNVYVSETSPRHEPCRA